MLRQLPPLAQNLRTALLPAALQKGQMSVFLHAKMLLADIFMFLSVFTNTSTAIPLLESCIDMSDIDVHTL